MVLELHVWPSLDPVPCLDAACLAAILYVKAVVPGGEWVLVESATNRDLTSLPALQDGKTRSIGFSAIAGHLRRRSAEWDLDRGLSDDILADLTAYTAHIERHAFPLLDLGLFVSSDNYTRVTRPRLSSAQAWPLAYVIPPALRRQAKKRSAHLGLSSLDIDSGTDGSQLDTSQRASIIPQSLRLASSSTRAGLLSQREKSQIRLADLTDAWLQPLEELLTEGYLFDTAQPTSLDCLAVATLAVGTLPPWPHAWLRDALTDRYPRLQRYIDRTYPNLLGGDMETQLPWQLPEQVGVQLRAACVGADLLENLPFVKSKRAFVTVEDAQIQRFGVTPFVVGGVAVAAAAVLGVGLALQFGSPRLFVKTPAKEAATQRNLNDLGEAGQALSALASHMDRQVEELP